VRKADNLPLSSADVTESGSLNLPEPSGLHRPAIGILYLIVYIYLLQFEFQPVATVGRLVQRSEKDSPKGETMHKSKQNKKNTNTENTQNRKQNYRTKVNIKQSYVPHSRDNFKAVQGLNIWKFYLALYSQNLWFVSTKKLGNFGYVVGIFPPTELQAYFMRILNLPAVDSKTLVLSDQSLVGR
jgi:hypothetical protein